MTIINQNLKSFFLDNDSIIEEFLNQNKEEQKENLNHVVPFKHYQKISFNWDNSDNVDSKDLIVYANEPQVVMFHPNKSFGTSAIRGSRPLAKNAFTYWQITISDRIFGTSIMIGIGSKEAKVKSIGYLNLLGIDSNSWGLSHKGMIWHDNCSKQFTNAFDENKCVKIGCLFDGYKGRLAYFINDVYVGIAFDNIKIVKKIDDEEEVECLYPMISSTMSQCIMKLDFCYQTFPTLQEICRAIVVKNSNLFNFIKLEYPFIPNYIKEYLES
jgi:SPRY domain-containing SOCS box protein 3